MASDWSNFGLPPVQRGGYGYTVASGVLRTPFDTAQPRQKRTNTLDVRAFSGQVQMTQAQLRNAEAAISAFGFNWFTMDLVSGYAGTNRVPGVFPSVHTVRLTADYRVSVLGEDLYQMDLNLETRPNPYQWVIADGQVWTGSATARYVGLQVSPLGFPATVRAVRFRAGAPSSSISSAFIVINGARTNLVTAPFEVGDVWRVLEIAPLSVPQGATVDLAMTCSSYAWVADYYKSSALLSGFEAGAEVYPPTVFSDNAFGIDLEFRQERV